MAHMKVAVTGGSGFIGRYAVEELHRQGHEALIMDRVVGIDLLDGRAVSDALSECDAVIHLAGMLGTAELFDMAEEAIDVNIKGALHVLQACKEHNVRYTEITTPRVWQNIYKVTKQAAFELAECYRVHFGVKVSHVRAYNVYGPGQKLKPIEKLIPNFSDRAYRGAPLNVYGDGTQSIDLIYAGDVARVLVDALQFGDGQVIEAGTGEAHSVLQVAGDILDVTESDSKLEFYAMRPGETMGEKPIASGEGWNLLGYRPEFRRSEFVRTVESYSP